ncbi:MAG: ScyD/ScyE family protein [Tepidiformaceae bacterium]
MSNRPSTLRGILIAVASGAFLVASLLFGAAVGGAQAPQPTSGSLLTQGLKGSIGSTIGPDGGLYVPEGAIGKISRVDPVTGATTVFASGLPPAPDFGGAFDVAFVGNTAYALVSVVEPAAASGIYRMDSPTSFTLITNLGAYSLAHPPPYPLEVPTGVQYALQPISGGFLVSDGHHNRILKVTMAGDISELIVFGNVVPTGLAVAGTKVYVSQVGPIPYAPSTGKVVSFELASPTAVDVASGFSAMVDVEIGPGGVVYALSQGDSPGIVEPGSPAKPNSGKLLRLNANGTFSVVVDRLNLPTSLDFIGDSAFIVTLNGEVWKINGVSQLQQIPATATPRATATRTSTPTSVPPTAVATSVPAAPRPPNTGSGMGEGGDGSEFWLFLGAALVLIASGSGILVRSARKR